VSTAPDVVFRAKGITKRYGGTQALKGVNFEIARGTVTALLGQNGAGKSTLMNIFAGVEQPTSGTLELDGELVSFGSDRGCRRQRHFDHPPGTEPVPQSQRSRQHLHGP